jgi:hypothetical protein
MADYVSMTALSSHAAGEDLETITTLIKESRDNEQD